MKKLLLATAIAALSVSAAQAAPTLYGKAFVTADYVNAEFDGEDMDGIVNLDEDESSVQINSNISRLGFKGSEAMTANTDVIYQLEYGINIDDSGDDNIGFKSRDTYLGLVNKDFGQFRFGRNYSVSDYINNVTVTEGYWYNIGSSSLDEGTLSEALTLTDGRRVNNSIIWFAPKYNDLPLELALQYSADEAFVSDSNDRDNGYGASLMYNPGNGFTAGIAMDKDMSINAGEILRASATVDLSKYSAYPVQLGALYQQADYDGADEEDGLIISAEMGLANFARPASVYAQYNKTENLGGLTDNDSDQIVVGGKYMFKDNMIAHAYVGNNSADLNNGLVVINNNNDTVERIDARGDADVFVIGGGLEYLF